MQAAHAIRNNHHVTRWQRCHTLERGPWGQGRPIGASLGQRLGIDAAPHLGQRKQRLYFGGKNKTPGGLGVKQRPDSSAVAREHQALPPCIPKRNRELPVKVINKSLTVFLKKVNDDFRV